MNVYDACTQKNYCDTSLIVFLRKDFKRKLFSIFNFDIFVSILMKELR